jgi:hypothetical protein
MRKVMSTSRAWRQHALALAAGLCLTVTAVQAQQSSGSIAGRASKGDTISVENQSIGVVRQLKIDSDGNWQIPQLPSGTYVVTLTRANGTKETVQVLVSAGQGATASFQSGAAQSVTITGAAIRTIDTASVASAFTLSKAEIDRIPVGSNVTAVTLLSPGTLQGDSRIGGSNVRSANLASIGGASVAENAYYINGFNVTNIVKGIAFNEVPFEAVGEVSIKNSGYGAEYGRSLGGVVSVTTKRGTNEWKGGGSLSYSPDSMRGSSVYADKSATTGRYNLADRPGGESLTQLNLYAGGPIIKDKLFFFGLVQAGSRKTETYGQDTQQISKTDTPQYLLKFDWNINDWNRLELTAFNDKSTEKVDNFNSTRPYDTGQGSAIGLDKYTSGGKNTILQWTSYPTSDLTLSALYGVGNYSRETAIAASGCPAVYDGRPPRTQLEYLGCWSEANLNVDDPNAKDKRNALRFDAEYVLGAHTLKAGLDRETYDTVDGSVSSGGAYYRLFTLGAGQSIGGTGYTNTTGAALDYVRVRFFQNGGTFKTKNSAWYVQDDWQVTKDVVVNFGMRNESFENQNDKGQPFIKVKNTWAPRGGVAWDVNGNGTTKLYGNLGRYYIPVYANTNVRLSGTETFYNDYFQFAGGFSTDGKSVPNLGPQLGNRVVTSDGSPKDPRTVVDPNIKPLYQDELILGFQQALADRWAYGLKFTTRKLKNGMDDVCEGTLASEWALANGYTAGQAATIGSTIANCFLYNPGGDLVANVPLGAGGALQEVRIPASALMLPKPKRTYNALEFSLERQWDKKWSAQVSYVMAFSKGNTEGYVKSDNGQDDAGITQDFDHPGLMEGSEGYLPNDRRHTIKGSVAYAATDEWELGGSFVIQSGRPKNCFGNYPEVVRDEDGNPIVPAPYPPGPLERDDSDLYGAASFYCNAKLNPRGSLGRYGWTRDFSVRAKYTPSYVKGLSLSVSVLNVLNARGVRGADEAGELDAVGSVNPTYGRPIIGSLQRPRVVTFKVAYEF